GSGLGALIGDDSFAGVDQGRCDGSDLSPLSAEGAPCHWSVTSSASAAHGLRTVSARPPLPSSRPPLAPLSRWWPIRYGAGSRRDQASPGGRRGTDDVRPH